MVDRRRKNKGKHYYTNRTSKVKYKKIYIYLIIGIVALIFMNINNMLAYFTDKDTITNQMSIANCYVVKFNSNNGSGTMENQEIFYNVEVKLQKNIFTREGYTFDGWTTESDGSGNTYTDEQLVKNLTEEDGAEINLYARWKANTYSVKFNSNNGTGTMNDQTFTYGIAQKFTKSAYTREGYTFDGWNTAEDGKGTSYTDEQEVLNLTTENNGVINLYAQWKANTYTITFDPNGGTTSRTLSATKYPNATINELPNTITEDTNLYDSSKAVNGYYTGSNFNSWGTVNNSNVRSIIIPVRPGDKITANSFKAYAESGNNTGNRANAIRISFMNGTTSILSKSPAEVYSEYSGNVKNGELGWITVPDGYDSMNVVWWTPDENNYVYILNPENSEKETQTVIYDSDDLLKKNIYGRGGYEFLGWNTAKDGSGKQYKDEEEVSKLNLNSDITLYAQWKIEGSQYTVTFVNYQQDERYKNLPNTYQKVEYIESTGSQYINTGYVATPKTKISMDISFSNEHSPKNYSGTSISNTAFLGTIDNSGSAFMLNWGGNSNQKNTLYVWAEKEYASGGRDNGRYISDAVRNSKNTLTLSNDTITWGTYTYTDFTKKTTTETIPIALFGSNRRGTFYPYGASSMRLYEMEIYEDEHLEKHYIPCYNKETSEIGLYDLINQEFLTSNSGTAFNKGDDDETETEEHTETQTIDMGVSTKLKKNTFEKTGYTFIGWNTKRDGSGDSYADEQEVINLTNTDNGVVKLYAQWEEDN